MAELSPRLWREAGMDRTTFDALRRSCLGPDFALLDPDSEGYLTLVIGEPGDPHGFVGARVLIDELHVDEVGVAPDHRRRGLARFLLDRMHGRARAAGARYAYLELRAGNDAARGLYEGCGYRVISRRTRYYRDGEDALVMLAFLDGSKAFDPGDPRGETL